MSTAPSELGRIKGAAFREFVAWWRREHGQDAVRDAFTSLPPALRSDLDPERDALGILPSTWYPAQVTHAIVDALIRDIPTAQLRPIADRGAQSVMKATVTGVYKAAFALLVSPTRYAKYSQRIWAMHYDTGTSTMEAVDEHTYRTTIAGWRGHHDFICMLNMAAGVPIFETMGCKGVRYEVVGCVSHGHPTCESLVRWD